MPATTGTIHDIAPAIQLALAPVFLLTGIAGILNVMAHRLGRIIDRGRCLADAWDAALEPARAAMQTELRYLEQRRHLTSWGINACTSSALLVCMVIAALFAEALFDLPLKWIAGVLFTASTLALIIGLALFLREVHLATHTVRLPRLSAQP